MFWASPSRPLCHLSEHQAPAVCVAGTGPSSLEVGCLPTSVGPSVRLCLPAVCSSQAGSLQGSVVPERVVHRPSVAVSRRTSRASASVERACPALSAEVPSRLRDPLSSRVKVIQHLIQKAGFSRKVARVAASDLGPSTAALYQS